MSARSHDVSEVTVTACMKASPPYAKYNNLCYLKTNFQVSSIHVRAERNVGSRSMYNGVTV